MHTIGENLKIHLEKCELIAGKSKIIVSFLLDTNGWGILLYNIILKIYIIIKE